MQMKQLIKPTNSQKISLFCIILSILNIFTPLTQAVVDFQNNNTGFLNQKRQLVGLVPPGCDSYAKIESGGAADGNYVRFYLNGVKVHEGTGYGLYFLKLNSAGDSVEETKRFQIGSVGVSAHVNDMTTWINSIPDDRIVLVGAQGDVSIYMTPAFGSSAAYTALESLGASSDLQFWINDAYALIGKKGVTYGQYGTKSLRAPSLFPGEVSIEGCASGCSENSKLFRVVSESRTLIGYKFEIWADGVKIKSNPGSGTHLEVFYPTGEHFESKSFLRGDSNDFRAYLDTLTTGYVVVGGIAGTGVYGGSSKYDHFTAVGAQDFSAVLADQPYAVIGKKGMTVGQGFSEKSGALTRINLQGCIHGLGCEPQCHTCTQSKDNCTSCKPGSNREGSDCHCISKYYQHGDSENCTPCAFMCNQCETYANKCKDGCSHATRDAATVDCQCLPGYYQVAQNEECSQCNLILCETCEGGADQCLTCSHHTRDPSDSCKCRDGHYDKGTAECGTCGYTCDTCQNSELECLTCSDSTRDQFNNCLCNKGYYQKVPLSQACAQCNVVKCAACETDENICTECSHASRDVDNDCQCRPKFYEIINQAQCGTCSHKCATCTLSPANCQQCSSTTRNSDDSCNCKPGFFQIATQEDCTQCNLIKCSTCTLSADNCSVCSHSTRDSDDSCNCRPGTVDLGVAKCTTCAKKCATCNGSPDTCVQCSDPVNRLFGQDCACKDGYYDDGGIQCQKCSHKCGKCEGSADNCTECSDSNRSLEDGCECMVGFFEELVENQVCGTCDKKCKSCSSTSDNCTECYDMTRENAPACSCAMNTVEVGEHSCECAPKYFFKENLEDISQSSCERCSTKCNVCQGTFDNCIFCSNGLKRSTLVSEDCKCADQYYHKEGEEDCQECDPNCATCEGSGACLTCGFPLFKAPQCKGFANGYGFFTVAGPENLLQTLECDLQCLECDQKAENCTTCAVAKNRSTVIPECGCLDGFHDNNHTQQDCIACPAQCSKCENNDVCTECVEGNDRFLNIMTGKCECVQGYAAESLDGKCEKCYQYKDQCYIKNCPPNTIQNHQNYTCEDKQIEKEDSTPTVIFTGSMIIGSLVTLSMISKAMLKNAFERMNGGRKVPSLQQQQEDQKQIENDLEVEDLDGQSLPISINASTNQLRSSNGTY